MPQLMAGFFNQQRPQLGGEETLLEHGRSSRVASDMATRDGNRPTRGGAGRPGVPIAPEQGPVAIACAQRQLESAGYFIANSNLRSNSVSGRHVVPISDDQREVDIISFNIERSTDGAMLLVRTHLMSRDEHGNAATPERYYYTDRRPPRGAAVGFAASLLEDCAR